MPNKSVDLGDLYQQLAMLTRAGLPLPQSLRQLAGELGSGKLRRAVLDISERTGHGETLAAALRRHSAVFPAFHARMLAVGEQKGALPEALFATANFSYFNYYMVSQARQIFIYPALTILCAGAVFVFINLTIIPGFARMFDEMLPGEPLPGLTLLFITTSAWCVRFKGLLLTGLGLTLVFCLWVFCPHPVASRTLLQIISRFPGSWRITHSLDSARICALLRIFLTQGVSVCDALNATASLTQSRSMQRALLRAADTHSKGGGLVAAMQAEPAIDSLVTFSLKQTPEHELPEELGRLATLYEKRVLLASRAAIAFWELLAICLMALIVGAVVLSLFLPLIKLIDKLGG